MQLKKVDTNPVLDCVARWPGESFQEYFIRLFENKTAYKITCSQIADLLNAESGNNYDESSYRKRFSDFNKGRQYERERGSEFVSNRILAISDLHVPYNFSIETFCAYCGNVDTLVLNGDIMDCQSISKFPKQYRINFIDEMIAARQYIIDLVDYIHPTVVYITKGNHEHRLIRYLSNAINEDLMSLMPDSPMDLIINDGFKNNDRLRRTEIYYPSLKSIFAEQGISITYDKSWYCRIGNIIFAHPLAYSASIMKTAEKAVTYFSRVLDSRDFTALILAHTHKVGFYKVGDVMMYEQGCCCRLDMLDYADGKLQDPQQNGYMYICLDKNGDIIEGKTRLITSV